MYSVIFLDLCHMFSYMRFILLLCHYMAEAMFWMLQSCMCVDSEISSSLLSVVKHMRMWLVICKKQYFLQYVYAYTLVSRWLPNTLCYNVCGISSEPVSAVAVYSEHSVLQCMWHLLWTFLPGITKNAKHEHLLEIINVLCELRNLYCLSETNAKGYDFEGSTYETTRIFWNLPTV